MVLGWFPWLLRPSLHMERQTRLVARGHRRGVGACAERSPAFANTAAIHLDRVGRRVNWGEMKFYLPRIVLIIVTSIIIPNKVIPIPKTTIPELSGPNGSKRKCGSSLIGMLGTLPSRLGNNISIPNKNVNRVKTQALNYHPHVSHGSLVGVKNLLGGSG
jgi:hypothetical protein